MTKVNDAIKYSIASALGFSFGENIYYLNSLWQEISTGQLAGMYFFRSIFTTAAHMVYSGVFGYFYGIGKFSMVINQQNIVSGKKDKLSAVVARIFNLPLSEGFRQKIILKGLFIAIAMHFTINYLLQLAEGENSRILMPIVLITNILMYLFLQYLLNRKAGHLILLTDPTTQKTSTMAKKDTEVVMELLAMWSKDKRYVDVIHVCERLLQRDPDNNVVKLFKAQAMDAMDEKDIYKKILGTVIKTKDDLSIDQKNIISKYVAEKKPTVTTAPSIPVQQAQQKNVLEKFTGEGTFKIH
ncbi:MAG: PrsW family glutamic-type intramembrane protease [Patescibacteria group bacterium]